MAAITEAVKEFKREKPETWIIGFPGQASQYVGMGKKLYESYGFLKELYELAEDITKLSLRKVIFEGPEEKLNKTLYSQPALVLTSIATYTAFREELEAEPKEMGLVAFSGHSLGEVSALIASGATSLSDGFRLVKERAIAMDKASDEVEGGMLAVLSKREPIDLEKLEKAVSELRESTRGVLEITNYNSPYQVIISGSKDLLDQASQKLKGMGFRCLPLKVSGPFHSSLMAPAEEHLRKVVSEIKFSSPEVPIASPTYLDLVKEEERIRNLIPRQMRSPVKWIQLVRKLPEWKVEGFLELGPKDVLYKLTKAISSSYSLDLKVFKISV